MKVDQLHQLSDDHHCVIGTFTDRTPQSASAVDLPIRSLISLAAFADRWASSLTSCAQIATVPASMEAGVSATVFMASGRVPREALKSARRGFYSAEKVSPIRIDRFPRGELSKSEGHPCQRFFRRSDVSASMRQARSRSSSAAGRSRAESASIYRFSSAWRRDDCMAFATAPISSVRPACGIWTDSSPSSIRRIERVSASSRRAIENAANEAGFR